MFPVSVGATLKLPLSPFIFPPNLGLKIATGTPLPTGLYSVGIRFDATVLSDVDVKLTFV